MYLNSDTLDKTLSFETVAGEKIRNYKFVEIFSSATVLSFKFDAPAKHNQYFPYITDGTPDNFTAYKYAKFLKPDGSVAYFGIPWVKQDTIVISDAPTRIVTLPPEVTDEQLSALKSFLTTIGIEGYVIKDQ